jgi:hypothetical protein
MYRYIVVMVDGGWRRRRWRRWWWQHCSVSAPTTFSTFPDVLRDRVQGRVIHWISLVPLYCSEMLIQKGGFTFARYGALELGPQEV